MSTTTLTRVIFIPRGLSQEGRCRRSRVFHDLVACLESWGIDYAAQTTRKRRLCKSYPCLRNSNHTYGNKSIRRVKIRIERVYNVILYNGKLQLFRRSC